ncbi:MAG: hypothetical protein IJV97_05770 [Alphaproteobacteria bacterium]|nr:hypothetical protein [Alphaproteobacteria bacterium]
MKDEIDLNGSKKETFLGKIKNKIKNFWNPDNSKKVLETKEDKFQIDDDFTSQLYKEIVADTKKYLSPREKDVAKTTNRALAHRMSTLRGTTEQTPKEVKKTKISVQHLNQQAQKTH